MKKGAFKFYSLGIMFISLFQFWSSIALTQNGNNNIPGFRPGVIYLQLDVSSGIVLTMPPRAFDIGPIQDLYNILDQYEITAIERPFIGLPSDTFDFAYRISFSKGEPEELIDELETLDIVLFAERVPNDHIFEIPSDPSVDPLTPHDQSSFQLELIDAFDAFDLHTGGNAILAIVDNAIYTGHEDISDNIAAKWDISDQDDDTNPIWSSNSNQRIDWTHGTHVAGVGGATTDNDLGVASPGWNNRLMVIKATPDNAAYPGFIYNGYDGITWAAEHGADVISVSWGATAYSEMNHKVIRDVYYDLGVIIVAAAGNEYSSTPNYPAAYGERMTGEPWEVSNKNLVIAVASIDENKSHSDWSHIVNGWGSSFGNWVDICTYGTSIYSTICDFDGSHNPITNHYGLATGTSVAAPLVASVAGLLKSSKPNAQINDIIDCLINSANPDIYDPSLPENLPGTLGRGRLNAFNALKCINSACPNPYSIIIAETNLLCPQQEIDLTASLGNSYLWNTGATTRKISVSTAGEYTVTINYGNCSGSASIELEDLSDLPYIKIFENSGNEENDGVLCLNAFATATAIWGKSYLWNYFDWTGAQLPNFAPSIAQSYNLSCTITDVGNCPDVDGVVFQQVIWMPSPTIGITYSETDGTENDGTICSNHNVEIAVNGGVEFLWSTGATTSSIIVHPVTSTLYLVTVTDENGCSIIKTAYVFVTDNCQSLCKCIDENNNIGLNQESETYVSELFAPTPGFFKWENACVRINGKLIIDHPTLLIDVNVIMGEGASIVIRNSQLNSVNSNFYGCEKLWKGITVEENSQIDFTSTIIEDAELAIKGEEYSRIFLSASKFVNNYIGLFLTNNGVVNTRIDFSVLRANEFTSTRSLKEPYQGHSFPTWPENDNVPNRPYAGIFINGIYGLDFGNDTEVFKNKFNHLRNGIIVKNISQIIKNVIVEDLFESSPLSGPSGFGIILTGGVDSRVENSIFKNMKVGISSDRSPKINIIGNIFENIYSEKSAPAIAILVNNHIGAQVQNNDITNASIGIQFNFNGQNNMNGFTIKDNILKFNTDKESLKGIEMNFVGTTKELCSINHNTLHIGSNGKSISGIKLSNCVGIRIINNPISFEIVRQFGEGKAIDIQNSRQLYVANNTLSTSVLPSQSISRTGIFGMIAFNNTYFCNSIDNFERGLSFSSICSATQLRNSLLGSNIYGLYLNSPTTLSDQADMGNIWQGTYTYQGIINGPANTIQGTAQNSRFFANPNQNSSGNVFFPSNLYPGSIQGIWFQTSNHVALTCIEEENPIGSHVYSSNNLVPIAKGIFKSGDFRENLNWLNGRLLFGLLEDSTNFRNLNSSIDSFYSANKTSNINTFDTIERIIMNPCLDDNFRADYLNIENNISDYLDSLEFIDSLFFTGGINFATYLPIRIEILDSLLHYGQHSDSLSEILNTCALDNFNFIDDRNTQIDSEEDYEDYQIEMNSLIIKVRTLGVESLTDGEKEKVEYYAFGCPIEFGIASIQAKSILSMYKDTSIDVTCDGIDIRGEKTEHSEAKFFVNISPNPSKDGWNIFSTSNSILQYQLIDLNGHTMQRGEIIKGSIFIEGNFPTGIYYLRINDNTNISSIHKLILIN